MTFMLCAVSLVVRVPDLKELIDTDKTDDISGWTVLDRLDVATHHKHGTLDRLDKQVGLGARDEVGTLNTDLRTSTDCTREDTAKSVKAAFIRRRHHLRDVKDEWTFGIAI